MRYAALYTDAIQRYQQFGDKRPGAASLREMIADIEYRTDPKALTALASMCVDLAMADRSSVRKAMPMAREALGDISSVRYTNNPVNSRKHAVTARLAAADLDGWRAAATGKPLANNYSLLVEQATKAASLTDIDDIHARAALAEGIPALLGARRHAQTEGAEGWLGRLSLFREDRRHDGSKGCGVNRSWDVSAHADGVDTFVKPTAKIQVKLGSIPEETAALYQRGGVIAISAKDYGFGEPGEVVSSCAYEQSGGTAGIPYLNSVQLDAMTDKLAEAISS